MKIKINKSDISNALNKVQGITNSTGPDINSSVLIRAEKEIITVSATNYLTGYTGEYPAGVESEGTIAINAKKMFEIVRDFPGDDITVNEIKKQWIEISSAEFDTKYKMVGFDPELFPEIPGIEMVDTWNEMDSKILKTALSGCIKIGGHSDDKRAHIAGLLIGAADGEVGFASTDGKRIIIFGNREIENGILVPKKELPGVMNFLDSAHKIQIGWTDNQFIMKNESEIITITTLHGDFPNFRTLIGRDKSNVIIFDKPTLHKALKRIAAISYTSHNNWSCCNFSLGMLALSAISPDIGEVADSMKIDYSGETLDVVLDSKLLYEMIAMFPDKICIDLPDGKSPCLIYSEEPYTPIGVLALLKSE